MPTFSPTGPADVMQQFFSFQMIVEPDGRSTVLPVTDIDKELFADKSDFLGIRMSHTVGFLLHKVISISVL